MEEEQEPKHKGNKLISFLIPVLIIIGLNMYRCNKKIDEGHDLIKTHQQQSIYKSREYQEIREEQRKQIREQLRLNGDTLMNAILDSEE